jgi:hypothetical protein
VAAHTNMNPAKKSIRNGASRMSSSKSTTCSVPGAHFNVPSRSVCARQTCSSSETALAYVRHAVQVRLLLRTSDMQFKRDCSCARQTCSSSETALAHVSHKVRLLLRTSDMQFDGKSETAHVHPTTETRAKH